MEPQYSDPLITRVIPTPLQQICNQTIAREVATPFRIASIKRASEKSGRVAARTISRNPTDIVIDEKIRCSPYESGGRLNAPGRRRGQSEMKKLLLAILLTVAVAGLAIGQQAETRGSATANSDTSIRKQGRQVELQSGTQLAAQLENSLDAKRAKPGDRVVLRTVSAVKQNGKVVVSKGAQLIGHVTDVQQQSRSNAESSIGIVIDRLRNGSTETPIAASILSITQARSSTRASNNDFESDTMARSSSSARSSGSGGGLLGGVGNTVGGVVNTTTGTVGSTTNAVGNTVGTTTSAAGSTAGNLTGSLRGLQITQSTDASAQGGSTLSLTGRNLHLENGTTFNLAVSSSTSAGNNP